MKKTIIKRRNVIAAQLWQCGAFHMRVGKSGKRANIAAKPTKAQLRATAADG